MAKLESVLAATDLSPDARHAVERAAMVCKAAGARRAAALHVIEASWLDTLKRFVPVPTGVDESLVAHATRSLGELAEYVRARSGVPLEPRVRVGSTIATIFEVAQDFDLLAVGARGAHPLRDFTLGTTAERLLRQTRNPMLVVREQPSGPYRRVLVAVDFSPHSRAAYAMAKTVAPEAALRLVHVFEVLFEGQMRYAGVGEDIINEYRVKARDEAELQMTLFADDVGATGADVQRAVEYGSHVPSTLLKAARTFGADLVVVGRHGKSLTETLLLGSVTEHLLRECPCDVLVTH